MLKVLKSLILTLTTFTSVFSQFQIIDKSTNLPIPFVNVLSINGKLIDISDINGLINIERIISNLNKEKSDSIEFSHLSYHRNKIKFSPLLENTKIYLIQNEIQLNEAQVIAEMPDFLVLKGFFRSYQLDNNVPKAYMDGIVEYFIPLKSKLKSFKINLIENRTFRNKKLFDSKIKYYNETTGDQTGPAYLEKETALNELKKYQLIDSSQNYCKIISERDTVGIINFDSINNTRIVTIKVLSPERSYERNFLDFNVKFLEFLISERFNMGNNLWNRKSNLLSRYEYRKQLVSHKKLMQSPIMIESFHEFYVIEKRYISNSECKEMNLTSFFGPAKTNYKTDYWKSIDSYGIPPNPSFIEELFGNVLEIY
jgi:hypothetical protein